MPFVLLGGLSSGFFPPPPGGGFFPPPPAPVFLPPLPLPPREILALGILGGRVLGGASRAGRRVAGSLAARPAAGARQGPWRRWRCGGRAGAAGGAEGGGVGRRLLLLLLLLGGGPGVVPGGGDRSGRSSSGGPRPRTSCLAGVTESNVKSQKSAALELPPKKAELPVSYFPQKIKNVRKTVAT